MTARKFFRPWMIYSLAAFALSGLLILLARLSDGFAEGYATGFYPLLVGTVGRLSGLFPFAVGELLIYLFVAAALFFIVFFIVKLIRSKGRRKKVLITAGAAALCTVSSVLLLFTLNCGVNYSRTPFSSVCGLKAEGEFTNEQLRELIVDTIGKANALNAEISRDEDGNFRYSLPEMREKAKAAMERLGESYDCLSGYYPLPKQWLFDKLMSYCFILGLYNPFSIEANYNGGVSYYSMPHTMCHELSHLKGFMREDEANYIAYIACRESGDPDLMYSGYLTLIDYALSYYEGDDYDELVSMINPDIINEYVEDAEHWEEYDTPIAEISVDVNNTYLEAQGVDDGVKSYGRFVDLAMYEFLDKR